MVGKLGSYWFERPPWSWERPFPWLLLAVYVVPAALVVGLVVVAVL